jgi:hypothetical protein
MNQTTAKYFLYSLVLILVFEGLLRKLISPAIGNIIFFLKDMFCIFALVSLGYQSFNTDFLKLTYWWKKLLLLFIPLFLINFTFSPVLIVWGGKLYLLYLISALIMLKAFTSIQSSYNEYRNFILFLVFLLVPTGFIAILQNQLPPSHWLNLAVGGGLLDNFSAAGKLRVSSTFSFTGQYSWFLNFISSCYFSATFLPNSSNKKKWYWDNQYAKGIFLIILIISNYITGGRTSVLGFLGVLIIGIGLTGIKNLNYTLMKWKTTVIILFLGMSILPTLFPDYFAAYMQRSQGYNRQSHVQEITNRVLAPFENAEILMSNKNFVQTLFGNGLGVMTNGADKVSPYAQTFRTNIWTENDFTTVLWEGGIYLFFIWYGFRLFMIYQCFIAWCRMKDQAFSGAAAFLLAYIIIVGLIGTLSLQPPISIWWWLPIGSLFSLKHYDQMLSNYAENLIVKLSAK